MADLANYQCKGGVFSKPFIWTAVDLTFGPNWWKGLCSSTELSKVAAKILQLPATSAACERSFSSYANIHSAKRNRLTNERAAKLVFVSQNLKLEAMDMRATQQPILPKEPINISDKSHESINVSEEESPEQEFESLDQESEFTSQDSSVDEF